MAKPELEFHDTELIPWVPVEGQGPGVYEKILSRDPADGSFTRLIRTEPGVTKPVLVHDHWEEVYILEGTITDLSLNKTFKAGYYACRPPGMKHGPFKTDIGSMSFEVKYYKK